MFQARPNEPAYAMLKDPVSQPINRYGKSIETVPEEHALRGQSLHINNDASISSNPNRYKQHGFFFNADNCIACHACESACSEKNDNPAHIAFRSVGYVEGGTYPNTQRINISMACNHCDNPVCLKGCPTRAYTKFAEYGAVLQDPDICFGCGYCTWVCPYNAPQLDPVKGQVSKCNMCVDRLEVGLKPACVSACLGKALDFGVIENIPEGRTQAKTEIPGFPRTDITHPNIRFQQTRTPHREMHRLDGMPLKYHQNEISGQFHPELDPPKNSARQWGLNKLLHSHENAHVAFTLSSQAAIGAFSLLTLGTAWERSTIQPFLQGLSYSLFLTLLVALTTFGLLRLNLHLGKPHRFYRGFYNLRWSPVSREILGVTVFFVGLVGFTLSALTEPLFGMSVPEPARAGLAALTMTGAGFGGYYMIRLYRIPARPFWDHWHTAASFIGSALSLGSLLLALAALFSGNLSDDLGRLLAMIAGVGLALEGMGLIFHARDLHSATSEGAASFYEQRTTYGKTYRLRNGLLILALLLATGMASAFPTSTTGFLLLGGLSLVSALLGRMLFYALVIPTTMPGAFFWKNRNFAEHARKSGLANMPQVGVAYEHHHAFQATELWDTLRATVHGKKETRSS